MSEIKAYIESLLSIKQITIKANRTVLFEEFISDETIVNAVNQIKEAQTMMTDKWILKNKIRDILEKQIIIPNATVSKPYETKIDFLTLGMDSLIYTQFEDLSPYGLSYDNEHEVIAGNPTKSGDFKIKMMFRVEGEAEDSELNVKMISLVINADPKSLWKNIPSTKTKDNFWKEDNVHEQAVLGSRHIAVASKRGRSHANVGSFRDDDYAFKTLDNGWNIVCVADGAGSASYARLGSKIACDYIIEYFSNNFSIESQTEIDNIIQNYDSTSTSSSKDFLVTDILEDLDIDNISAAEEEKVETNGEQASYENVKKAIQLFLYNNLGQAAFKTHKKLEEEAKQIGITIKDLHSTLIFALYKKYDTGYAILSFGVGDCPIALINKDKTEIKLMNWLDVGEYGGGTRFITMPEIFSSEKFVTRLGFEFIEDFSYLMLMTDGIYDPKFVVEANLEKMEKWTAFLEDLAGHNEDKASVEFNADNHEVSEQLSNWMDFWSPGNHDDRTLAIVF